MIEYDFPYNCNKKKDGENIPEAKLFCFLPAHYL